MRLKVVVHIEYITTDAIDQKSQFQFSYYLRGENNCQMTLWSALTWENDLAPFKKPWRWSRPSPTVCGVWPKHLADDLALTWMKVNEKDSMKPTIAPLTPLTLESHCSSVATCCLSPAEGTACPYQYVGLTPVVHVCQRLKTHSRPDGHFNRGIFGQW